MAQTFLSIVVITSAFGCGGGAPIAPPELSGAPRYEIVSDGKMFSALSLFTVGDYEIEGRSSKVEEEEGSGERIRTVRKSTIRVTMKSASGSTLEANCLDTFAWTRNGEKLLSEDVVDSFECQGEGWSLSVAPGEGNGYGGKLQTVEGSIAVRSLHERFAGMDGALAGYAFGERGNAMAAMVRSKNGKPGNVWMKPHSSSEALVLAAVALLYFDEGR